VSILVVAGIAHTVNEQNNYGKRIVKLCYDAAVNMGNANVLNQTTDDVSCEVD
jgi:hypothetical protein